ncbi:hypothetical protein [uncultured Thermanaerothrix sp.]|uniref:hypothetical protein n=1 Tax=uncultured Thermanaerothrix sp. TaxID=1195149 RepID=UPI002609AAC5|nr:hypothetical protein [uncultured Thermanaerothrix sp.]
MLEGMTLTEDGKVRLTIEVDSETAAEIVAVLQAEGWQPAEGYRLLLGAGLGYAQGQAVLRQIASGQLSEAEAMRQLLERLTLVEGKLANTRFRLFEVETENKHWHLTSGAIRTQNVILNEYAEKLKAENEALRREIAALRARVENDKGK